MSRINYGYRIFLGRGGEDAFIMFGGGVGPHSNEGTETDSEILDKVTADYLFENIGLDGDNNTYSIDGPSYEPLGRRDVTVGEVRQILANCPSATFDDESSDLADCEVFAHRFCF